LEVGIKEKSILGTKLLGESSTLRAFLGCVSEAIENSLLRSREPLAGEGQEHTLLGNAVWTVWKIGGKQSNKKSLIR